jgi:Neuraminidase (sialidase)
MTAKYPGTSRIISQATADYPRHSEADIITLADGRLLLGWGRKAGGDDFSEGCLMGMYSSDGGETWDGAPHVIRSVWDEVMDVGGVNFCRSPRGIHLFFIGRDAIAPGADRQRGLTKIYQAISPDEGETWSYPVAISSRSAYQILNNARVIRCESGRLIAPIASVPGPIFDLYDQQRVHCLYSDDDGVTWRESNELALVDAPLMEPGVVVCGDGSLYMTIRTKLGCLYEARSHDLGTTWQELKASPLPSAEAPGTVIRDPDSGDLWMFWCNTPYTGRWFDRHDVAMAVSRDHGATWSAAITLEHDVERSYAYISVLARPDRLLLTYYDWKLDRQKNSAGLFDMTSLRQRTIPLSEIREGFAF